jgi:hypothetical protein
MQNGNRSNIAEIRSIFARLMAAASGSADPRLHETAIAVYKHVWFSSAEIPEDA